MEWINTRAGQMQKSPIRKLFDRASGMRDVIHLEMGEPDLPTPAAPSRRPTGPRGTAKPTTPRITASRACAGNRRFPVCQRALL